MQTKLNVKELKVGSNYIAYSVRSKMLSSNGNCGVFVKVLEVKDNDVKVAVLQTHKSMVIRNLGERADAWIYEPVDEEIQVVVNQTAVNPVWPKFTQKMIDAGWPKKALTLKLSSIENDDREEYKDIPIVYHEYEEDKAIMIRLGWLHPASEPEWRIPRIQRMQLGVVELPLPPKPALEEVTEELLQNLAPVMKDFKKWANEGTCAYVFVTKDGKHKAHKKQPCHASVARESGDFDYIITTSNRKAGQLTDEDLDTYIHLLTSYSPYKDLFLVKDAKFIRENGYVLTLDAPAELLASALFATRQPWEYPHYVSAGIELLKQGVHPTAALLFGFTCSSYNGKTMALTASNGGHCPLGIRSMSDECFKNFLKGKPETPGKNYKQVRTYEYKVNRIWSEKYDKAPSTIQDALDKITSGGARGYGAAKPKEVVAELAADIIEDWIKKNKVKL